MELEIDPREAYEILMLFTPEVARDMAARAVAKRAENTARMKADAALTEQARNFIAAQAESSEVFVKTTIGRVRKKISETLDLIDKEKDAVALEKLCRSLAMLCEDERKLSGRPLPGSNRPRAEKPRRALAAPDPVETPQAEPPSDSGSCGQP